MPREITHHDAVLDAIANSGVIEELVERQDGSFRHELDLEVIVYGRSHVGKNVGPYARLLVYAPGEEVIHEGDWGGNTFYILISGLLNVFVQSETGQNIKVGEIKAQSSFGEMSVLAGQPRNATIVVPPQSEGARVLEVQRPALRLLKKLKKFGDAIDANYHQHGLDRTILDVQRATENAFDPVLLQSLKEASHFTVYARDHILFQEGDPVDRLIFIKNGWVRRLRGLASNLEVVRSMASNPMLADMVMDLHQDVGLDFLGNGNWLGFDALASGEQINWKYTATVMARTEVLEVYVSNLRSNPQLVSMISQYFPKFSTVDDRPPGPPLDRRSMAAAGKEISTGVVDGTNLLVMDMDLCIRCGNCSLACHNVHGQSRLLRRGIHITRPVKPTHSSIQHVLMPSVCLHCQDPECLTGCPTGAIGRFSEGQIDIDPGTCIGCADCATQCPYNAISMVPRTEARRKRSGILSHLSNWISLAPASEPSAVTETEDLLAVKCNLCENTPLNPVGAKRAAYSCQENCPTGALVRVNPREYFSEAKNAIGIVFKDQTHAIGRDIHKRDLPAMLLHVIGTLSVIGCLGVTLWLAARYTLDGRLFDTWLTVRWITGIIGLGGIAVLMTYPLRKQVYRRKAGPLRYWMQVHVYLGVIAGLILLLHGGRHPGGVLTSFLMISFDLVIITGLFGVACYLILPRIMTSIEGDPLLVEDLRARRSELRETLSGIDTSDPQMRDLVKKKMRRRFFSFRYLVRQYLRREELTTMLAEAREEFRPYAEQLESAEAKRSLLEAVEATATLRRLDSLIYLHQLLKLWLAPHVVSTSLMLALMFVHIIQVVFFAVR